MCFVFSRCFSIVLCVFRMYIEARLKSAGDTLQHMKQQIVESKKRFDLFYSCVKSIQVMLTSLGRTPDAYFEEILHDETLLKVSSLSCFTLQSVPFLPSLFREFPPFLHCSVSSLPFFTVQRVPSLSSLFSKFPPFLPCSVSSLPSLFRELPPFLHCSVSSLPFFTVQ